MDDLISRRSAIDAIKKLEKTAPTAQHLSAIFDCEDTINALPSAQQWISCEERLPESYTDVLVWFEYYRYGDYNRLYQMHGIGTYIKEYDSWIINHETGWRKLRVLAWCPLPKPYKEHADADHN